ncbi:unnamed protein product [Ostreobium quekettii]|uniref:Insulin-degrading enzyme n=1 Tax=Ostreobium quekettii TaxID=121088 RepID=A0A8S1J7H5_9CHLO|nr:unnamed protein product [Ostreobium quekettii]|eukprot:evm.model.scf_854.5 EVM.evm.TU.scf_854.5   scf_854:21161-28731(+)
MTTTDDIAKPLVDRRSYATVTLQNGLQALLISDAVTDKAAAALDVNTGSLDEPDSVLGLAHFTEHMLFYASEKYPTESEYSKFIQSHGGSTNATTALENTSYQFDVNWDNLEPALDRFAQFFVRPIISPDGVEREMKAVHSEHSKNLNSDAWRALQLSKTLSKSDHPYHRFHVGNLQTLGEAPRAAGIEPHIAVREFTDKHYSANLMKLVVYGRESVEELQKMVEEKFGGVINKGITRSQFSGDIFGKEHVQLLLKVVPQKDDHTLRLQWAVPPEWKVYWCAPCHYVSNLLGHEGKGSVFALLKELGYATSLSAGESGTGFSERSMFHVSVELTDLGNENAVTVLDIIFKYLAILQGERGVSEEIFNELKAIDEMSFNFKEKSDPFSYTKTVAHSMHWSQQRDWLRPNVSQEYNPEAIRAVLKELTPSKLRVMWMSKTFKGTTDQVEAVYGTEYSCETIPEEWIKRWTNPEQDDRLHLPEPNPFVPTDFTLLNEPGNTPHPQDVFSGEVVKMWNAADTSFEVPKAHVYLRILCPKAYESPESAVLNRLFVHLLTDSMNELAYPAEIAGLSYGICATSVGIRVTATGYTHKLMTLVDMILDHMLGLEIKESRFQIVHEQVQREYINQKYMQPYQRAIYTTGVILEHPKWHTDMYMEVIKDLAVDDVASFVKDLFKRCHIIGLITGNMSNEQAAASAQSLERRFSSSKKIFAPQLSCERLVKIRQGSSLRFSEAGPNPENDNSAVNVVYQIGPDNLRTNALSELLVHIGGSEAFEQLRTVEQLGYIVVMLSWDDLTVRHVRFIIQSSSHSASHLDARVESFLDQLQQHLEGMDCATYEKEVEELSKAKLEKPKRLSELASRYWHEIVDGTYLFDRQEREVGELRGLTKEDFIEFFKSMVHSKQGQRKLSVHVVGAAELQRLGTADAPEGEGVKGVSDIWEFKRGQELYASVGEAAAKRSPK